jgi:Domain of Unknown Function (DUF930)
MTLALKPGGRVRAWSATSAAACALLSTPALSGSIKEQLAKLDPEERAHQACGIKGLEAIKHDRKLPGADRLKTGIFGRAAFVNNVVTAKGGAVKAKNRWYNEVRLHRDPRPDDGDGLHLRDRRRDSAGPVGRPGPVVR